MIKENVEIYVSTIAACNIFGVYVSKITAGKKALSWGWFEHKKVSQQEKCLIALSLWNESLGDHWILLLHNTPDIRDMSENIA